MGHPVVSTIYTVLCDHQYTIYRMLTHWEPKTKPCVLSPRSEAGLKGHFRQRGVLRQPIFAPILSKPPYRHCRILKSDLTINDLLKNKIKKENPDEPSSSFVLWNHTIQHLTTCTANIYLCPVASTSLPR